MSTGVPLTPGGRPVGMHADPITKAATLRRTNDDMRQRISTLKSAIHSERVRNQEVHREKVMEIRELRDFAQVSDPPTPRSPSSQPRRGRAFFQFLADQQTTKKRNINEGALFAAG